MIDPKSRELVEVKFRRIGDPIEPVDVDDFD